MVRQLIITLLACIALVATAIPALAQDDDTPPPPLGITYRDNGTVGVIITTLVSGGAAERAGLQIGDTIVAIDDRFINGNTLPEVLATYQRGQTVTLDVVRGDNALTLNVVLGTSGQGVLDALGITYVDDGRVGVVITRVERGSAAADAGLQADDVLVSVNGVFVTGQDLPRVMDTSTPRLTLGVRRGADTIILTAVMAENRGATVTDSGATLTRFGLVFGALDDQPIVVGVAVQSPAAERGFLVGDLIVAVDGRRVATVQDARSALVMGGLEVEVVIERDGNTVTLSSTTATDPTDSVIIPRGRAYLGVNLGNAGQTPVVISVEPNSPASDTDIIRGDLIRAINGQDVETVGDVLRVLATFQPGDQVSILLTRDNRARLIFVTLDARPD